MAGRKRKKRSTHKRAVRRKKSQGFSRIWLIKGLGIVLFAALLGVVALNYFVVKKFEGSKWALPAHVYGRPLELYSGLRISREQLLWELKQLGYRSVYQLSGPGQYHSSGNRLDVFTRPFRFWDGTEAPRRISVRFSADSVTRLTTERGDATLVRLEPLLIGGIYPEHLEDRILVRLESLPPYLVDALIAVEDRNFYSHSGISLRGILRAAINNLRPGASLQGGSTITQQLVKNFYLSHERSLVRKGTEAIMALVLEFHYSKAEILETYLNEVYLGQSGSRGIHGFGMASRHYFRQPLQELDLHQVALLVGLVKGASYYDPWRHPERARQRRNLVLNVLQEQGVIDADLAGRTRGLPLGLAAKPGTSHNPFPAYLDLVRRQLQQDYRQQDLQSAGLRIFTSFDPQVQRNLEKAITGQLNRLEAGYRIEKDKLQAASVVVRVGTGEVLAVAGARQPGFAGFNRALDARRQVGSTIKPAVYLTALSRSDEYQLASPILDEPITVPSINGESWSPRNFERKSHGEVPLYEALGHSYNQATARLGMELGLPSVADTIRGLGYDGGLQAVPALLLGAVAMSPFDVAGIYHTIAADGFLSPLRGIQAVYTAANEPLKRYPFATEQRFDTQVMHLLQYGLQVVMREGTGRSAYRRLPAELAVAGKTGTSSDQRDSWFAGFSGNYLAVTWVGRDDNVKMPLTGATGALQVWTELMSELDNQSLPFVRPDGIDYLWIDSATGKLSGEGCAGARYLPFVTGSEPKVRGPCYPGRESDMVKWFKNLIGL